MWISSKYYWLYNVQGSPRKLPLFWNTHHSLFSWKSRKNTILAVLNCNSFIGVLMMKSKIQIAQRQSILNSLFIMGGPDHKWKRSERRERKLLFNSRLSVMINGWTTGFLQGELLQKQSRLTFNSKSKLWLFKFSMQQGRYFKVSMMLEMNVVYELLLVKFCYKLKPTIPWMKYYINCPNDQYNFFSVQRLNLRNHAG